MTYIDLSLMKTSVVGGATEPIGIVISRGSRVEEIPRFRAYIWGPAPEPGVEPTESRAT